MTHGLRRTLARTILAFALILTTVGAAEASGGSAGFWSAAFTPLQLAWGPPGLQVFTDSTPVYGLSFSVINGDQDALYGLGLGLFSDAGELGGLQIGMGNKVLHHLYGMQIGVANNAESGSGVQIGLYNRSHSMKGLQLGLINFNDNGLLPILPFFNIGLGGGEDGHH